MQHIIRHLFKADSLEEVSRERLEELVQEHPSFSIGHYLLSSKLYAEDAADFTEETQKTNLYFPNPFWLQWLLRNTVKADGVVHNWPTPVAAKVEEFHHAEEAVQEARVQESAVEIAEPGHEMEMPEPVITGEPGAEQEVEAAILAEESPENREPAWRDGELTEATIREQEDQVVKASTQEGYITDPGELEKVEDAIGEEREEEAAQEIPEEQPESVKTESSADILLRNILEARSLRQSLHQINEEFAGAIGSGGQPDTAEPKVEEVTEAEAPVETVAEVPAVVHEEPVAEPVAVHEERVEEAVTGAPVGVHEEPMEARVETVAEAPIFESFHTIDYFASQGIKLSLDENPDDRLGKQMKSFTDWLKVMKRIPQKNAGIIPDLAAEHQVQAIAAHSIEGKEVVTETMAEVLAKQGMREKATEVYRKLSLLNPDKSAYFASRIEQLKIL